MLNPARKLFLILALSFAASATNLDQFESHHPTVGGVDRLCTVSNTVNGTCTISKQLIRLTYDFYYTTNLSLVFDASILRCMTVDYLPCNIWFSMSG
jgi:lipopolysaccharide/colanic/teichoic acid biosynthesis glycosyltransferase